MLSTPFEFQIVLTPKPMHHTESTTLVLSLQKFPRTAVNADKPHLWKADTRASVDQFNQWFMKFAPKAYRDTRKKTIESVEQGLKLTKDLTTITPDVIKANPGILPTLRMSTCPPLARDRLIGLSDSTKNFVGCLEEGKLPPHLPTDLLDAHLKKITAILSQMLDVDIFPWIEEKRKPSKEERYRSSTIVADRLCGLLQNPSSGTRRRSVSSRSSRNTSPSAATS